MGHNKPRKSLTEQVMENLNSKLAIGESKYEAKLKNAHTEKIYSWSTRSLGFTLNSAAAV